MKAKIKMVWMVCLLCWSFVLVTPVSAESSTQFLLTADKSGAGINDLITYTMSVKGIKDLYAYEAKFNYDPSKLELQKATSNLDGFSVSPIKNNNQITIAHTKIGNVSGESGDVTIGTLVFKVKAVGAADIKWDAMKVVDHNLGSLSYQVDKKVSVTGSGLVLKDIQGHWAAAMIQEAVEKGIVNGFEDGTFHPNDSITRAQFATILVRALHLKEEDAHTFADSDQIPDWAKPEIAKAVKAGIINGYENDTFRAEAVVTRSEIAVMVARAMKLSEEKSGSLTFADNALIPEWAKGWITGAVRKGIIEGRDNNEFAPNSSATRAEAVVLVLRMLKAI